MGVAVQGQAAPTIEVPSENQFQGSARSFLGYLKRNRQMVVGIVMLSGLVLFVVLGSIFYDTSKYLSLTGHVFTGVIYLMSMKRFQALPADLQKVVADAAILGANTETELYNDFDTKSLEVLKTAHGMEINTVDKAAFRARMQPVFDRFQDRVGKSLIETVRGMGA